MQPNQVSAAKRPSLELLNTLTDKLKVANLQSIYLKATVSKQKNRLDLVELGYLNQDDKTPAEFLKQLLSPLSKGGFTFSCDTSPLSMIGNLVNQARDLASKRLQYLHSAFLDDYAEHGTKNFGFGFPIISFRSLTDPKRCLTAPLLVWYLDLETEPKNHKKYIMKRFEEKPVIINPQLINYLQFDRGIRIKNLDESFLDDGYISKSELNSILNQFQEAFNCQWTVTMEQTPTCIEAIEPLGNEVILQWAGLFGIYKSSKESIIQDYEQMMQNYNALFANVSNQKPFQKDYFAAVPLDPSQENILRTLAEKDQIIIQGPPGTGKSNSLTGILLNALENEVKCLVVCEKRTAMEVLKENLSNYGLGQFVMMIDDVYADRQAVVKQIRSLIDDKPFNEAANFGLHTYKDLKSQHALHINELNEKLENTSKKFFGDTNWKEIVAHHYNLSSNNQRKLAGKRNGFALSYQEFKELTKIIEESANLNTELPPQAKALTALAKSWAKAPYSRFLQQSLEQKLSEGIKRIEQNIGAIATFRDKFNKSTIQKALDNSLFLKIKAVFSKQTKDLIQKAKEYQQMLSKLHQEMGELVNANLNIENKVDKFVQWEAMLTNWHQQLMAINHAMISFPAFQPWNHFKSQIEHEKILILIDELNEFAPNRWVEIFKAWYLEQVLLKYEQEKGAKLPSDNRHIEQLTQLENELSQQQNQSIEFVWNAKRKQALAIEQIQQLKLLFNLRKNNTYQNRTTLRQLFAEKINFLTDFFPVLMVNPAVASSILPLQAGLFQIVMFDEASQLKVEDTLPSLLRGNIQIVSGDMHQMPPSSHFQSNQSVIGDDIEGADDIQLADEESLLNFAQTANFHLTHLDFHYRSQHPALIAFSNAAFYADRLIPMPPLTSKQPIVFKHVGGINIQNTNPEECKAIIDILSNDILIDKHGNWPSIGIATFNQLQQQYIREQLWAFADKDTKFAEKLIALEEAGLFIKNLENIQGDQRDIIIISTTFGPKQDQSFSARYGPINLEKGYKLLNVIVTRAKTQVFVITSVPREVYRNYQQEIATKGNTGKGIFHAYLQYAEFCYEQNESGANALLAFLASNSQENSHQKSHQKSATSFEEVVFNYLSQYFDSKSLKIGLKYGGFQIDLALVNATGKPVCAILCDGKNQHQTKVAYRYELHQEQILNRFKIPFYRLWSAQWWYSPEKEQASLKAFISKNMTDK